jgi:hypothetical protein
MLRNGRKSWLSECPQPFLVERTVEEGGEWRLCGSPLEIEAAYDLLEEVLQDPNTVSARIMCALEYCFSAEAEEEIERFKERGQLRLMDLSKKDIRH